ncbi:MAG: PLP-dependent transferase, partial [Clostridiales bacterium]|nr:PLP-dependent transferase [Clostridiales bacterium]
IYQSATFRHPGLNRSTGYDYSRVQNPTREELENTIAELENGRHGFAFSSGMAAISAVLSMFSPGGHLLVSDDLYGGTYRLFEEVYKRYGIDFSYVDTSDINEVKSGLKDNTKAIFIETPSNPMMKVTDLLSVCGIAKGKGILTIVDNTFLTPYYQKPLELGADLVLHSGTKYLAGHNDTLAGLVVVKDEGLAEKLAFIQKSTGAVLGPFDSWLVLRGIKTLAVRLDRQQQNAMKIAQWLRNHDEIETVYYAGLPDHQDYDVSLRQSTGFGGMLSFTVKRIELIERMLERLKLVLYAESLGGVESLITYPSVQTHAAIPDEIRNRIGVNDRLLRLSVGIENVDDIINDLEQAMK